MKFILTTLSIMCLVLTNVRDTHAQNGTKLNLLVGPNYAWGKGDQSFFESTPQLGFSIGGSIQTTLQKNLGFELQMLYSYNQAKYKFHESDPYYDYSATLSGTQEISFIDMPLLVSYNRESFLNKIKIGFVPSWAISANTKNTYRAEDPYDTYVDHFSGDNDYIFKSSDIGFTVGTEIKIAPNVHLDVRYIHGLRNILEDSDGELNIKRSLISALLLIRL